MTASTVLITSAGRRNYLVRWFREALTNSPGRGCVIAADSNQYAAARMEADEFAHLPDIDDASYPSALLGLCAERGVDLALSLNDFELSYWAGAGELDSSETVFLRLTRPVQSIVEDKLALSQHLAEFGVAVPHTTTARDVLMHPDRFADAGRVVIKNRFGSGSAGLVIANNGEATDAIKNALSQARSRTGSLLGDRSEAAEAIVVQRYTDGQEYGIDVVNDFDRRYRGTLARRKLTMRGGETDTALSVDSAAFQELSRRLSDALTHRGPVDVDVIVSEAGHMSVIDINPRFGGGYPFSHMAGADLPRTLISWLQGNTAESHLEYEPFVRAAKHVGLTRVTVDEAI